MIAAIPSPSSGLVLQVGLYAVVNLAVATGLAPTTGLPLPFVQQRDLIFLHPGDERADAVHLPPAFPGSAESLGCREALLPPQGDGLLQRGQADRGHPLQIGRIVVTLAPERRQMGYVPGFGQHPSPCRKGVREK